ncbi:MAG: tetratricopeptide repeat protein [Phycisphaeraceae bacterium]
MSQTTLSNQMKRMTVGLLVGLVVVLCTRGVMADEVRAGATPPPPQALVDAGLLPEADAERSKRAEMTWAQVQTALKPTPWPAVEPKQVAALSAKAADLIKQAESAMGKGEVFAAVQLLRQAEQADPQHPKVMRALGLAYAESGNLKRASSYLYPIAVSQRDDVEVLLVLARHASQSEPLEQVFAYCDALDNAKAPSLFADAYRSTALHRLGYTAAATDRQANTVKDIDEIDLGALKQAGDVPAALRRELSVMKAMRPQLRIELGDLYLQSRDYDRALKAYADVELDDPAARHLLGARRVYLAVLTGDQAIAIDQVIALLGSEDPTADDAALVDYLVQQGVSAQVLAARVSDLLAKAGVNQPRLFALSRVAEKDAVLSQIEAWLSSGPVNAERLRRAVSLVSFDDDVPADAEPLADLLVLVANRIAKTPDKALLQARAAVGAIDAPVTLLRAIQSDKFAVASLDMQELVSAVVYQATGRKRDALDAYRLVLKARDDQLVEPAVLPTVRLQLALGLGHEAHALLGDPDINAPWPMFELSLRAMSAAGKSRDALGVIDLYIKNQGKQLKSDVLRIELIAEMGQPQEACNLLLRLISTNPNEESLYHLGIDLSYNYRASFNRMTDAERMRRAFLTRLISNLPESSLARIGMAQNIRSNPARLDEAKALLLGVLEDEPTNAVALSLMVDMYDEAGEDDASSAMHERYAQSISIGMPRVLLIADHAVSTGKMARAKQVIDDALELDGEGVLPGPAMTGDQASLLLRHLEAADPNHDNDKLYLVMVRRFPDHAGLNNALGYRWAVENKNLRQAAAMIQRALQQEPTNHSLLDSLAWVQYKLGDFETAFNSQSRALMVLEAQLARFHGLDREMGATIAILNDHMGDILYKLEDPNKALKHWREAMKHEYTEEEMLFDPELRTLEARLKAKVEALAAERPVPVAKVPGPESYGPEGHPADIKPEDQGKND